MKLQAFIASHAIIPELTSSTRDDVIRELIEAVLQDESIADPALAQDLIDSIIEREKHGSTGFGKGVAVPHVKHEKINKMAAAIGVSQQGVDFNALDKQPVYSIVLLLSPKDHPDEHLQAMESIFSQLQNDQFRKFLRQSSTRQEIEELIEEADAQQLPG
ncbi:PTS sugar transporter subunit IIA [Mucisphaera calidilacus]|uniref:PTS system mannose-specific EIIBCA component n=1 Tax=Mucisphaera calidilacus TaxID=2527982 RepID=A0A518BW28_9BACT|nr:PTS sugar transporter subunit IIA [Mucisphaera calidilacus]QDU71167.1 PTS system mannose-specific EIIBCA component [Mucisphaera calidilacus]